MPELILLTSTIVQFTAAIVALTQIRMPNNRLAWSVITVALFLMGMRRVATLYDIQVGNITERISLTPEFIALAISLLMLIGVFKMGQVFREMMCDKSLLTESEARLHDFANVSADWFWEQDKDLRFTFFSINNAIVSGLLPEDLYGKTRRETKPLGVTEAELAKHEQQLEEKKPFEDFRFYHESHNGEKIFISISGKPFFDPKGNFLGYRGSGRDISAMVKTDQILKGERDKAEKAVRTKTEFLASMSHELRTPLNAILGFSEMLKLNIYGPLGNPKNQEFAQDIQSTGKHLLAIINDILDLSQIEVGKLPVIASETDIAHVLNNCIDIVRMSAAAKNIEIIFVPNKRVPNIHVDSRQLLQIFLNLINNAIKYSEIDGRVEISVDIETPKSVIIQIRDSGIGIEPSEISRMLEMFERAEHVMTRKEQGTGLGLPIARSLVELNGGEFAIESTAGKGTTVTLRFPRYY